jgi:hypothetical protein
MLSPEILALVSDLAHDAAEASRGNVVVCEASENSARLTIHSINGGTVASLSASPAWPLYWQAEEGVRKDPAWPIVEALVRLLSQAHAKAREAK